MTPEELIERTATAVRGAKYCSRGERARSYRAQPPSAADRKYAAAAAVTILRELAAMQLRLDPEGLEWWALEIEGATPS